MQNIEKQATSWIVWLGVEGLSDGVECLLVIAAVWNKALIKDSEASIYCEGGL